MTINTNYIRTAITLLIEYATQKGVHSLSEANFIVTGSCSLFYSGNLDRAPNDVDIIIQTHNYDDNHKKVKDAIFEFGKISGAKLSTSNSFGDEESIKEFIGIQIQGINWDFWITDTDIKTLVLKMPYSEIQLAHPDYTWAKKLHGLSHRKDLQAKALADIISVRDKYNSHEFQVLKQLLSQDSKNTASSNDSSSMTTLTSK